MQLLFLREKIGKINPYLDRSEVLLILSGPHWRTSLEHCLLHLPRQVTGNSAVITNVSQHGPSPTSESPFESTGFQGVPVMVRKFLFSERQVH